MSARRAGSTLQLMRLSRVRFRASDVQIRTLSGVLFGLFHANSRPIQKESIQRRGGAASAKAKPGHARPRIENGA